MELEETGWWKQVGISTRRKEVVGSYTKRAAHDAGLPGGFGGAVKRW
jgi:hypothetical protein